MTARPVPVLVTTGGLLLAAYVAAMIAAPKPDGRVVFGDATHHFVQLRSIVYDGDVHFANDYQRIYQLDEEVPGTEWIFTDLTSTGHVRNYMPLGPALLWAPLYLLITLIQMLASAVGLARPPDGFSWLQQMAPGTSGIIAATVAAVVSWRTVRRMTGEPAALLGVMAAWLGTHVVYYSLVSPAYSHAASMLTAALFFGAWLTGRDRLSVPLFAGWGALAGLAALMRWQDAIFLIVPAIEAARWSRPPAHRLGALAVAGGAFLVVFSPQMLVWHILYGQPFAIPQGPSFMQWTSPHPFAVLFSDNHGLLSWAPMIALALVGLAAAVRRQPAWRLPIVAILLISWYVNAAVADWWAGEAFGARRFISLFPLFALGLAVWLAPAPDVSAGGLSPRRMSPTRIAWLMVFGALNWLLLLQYQLFMKGLHDLAAYPSGWFAMWMERFVVPFRLLGWLLN